MILRCNAILDSEVQNKPLFTRFICSTFQVIPQELRKTNALSLIF